MTYQPERKTPYIVAIGLIWGFCTAMLAICIPLVSVTQSGVLLPLSVVVGAVVGTAVVWRSPTVPLNTTPAQHHDILPQQIVRLEAGSSDQLDGSDRPQLPQAHPKR